MAPAPENSTPLSDSIAASWDRFLHDFEPGYAQIVSAFSTRLDLPAAERELLPLLEEYLLRPGKRIRPFLFYAGFRLFASPERPFSEDLFRPASGLELFHNFVLIHDDVIDGAETRRRKPSLQNGIREALGCSLRHAEHLAVVLGDMLFAYATAQFSHPPHAERILPGFLQLALETGAGEGLELLNTARSLDSVLEGDILKTYELKTTRYTFEGPLRLGALSAGAPGARLDFLTRIARPLGLAFQIENDLHEIRMPAGNEGGFAVDFLAGVKTIILHRYFQESTPGERKAVLELLSQDDPPLDAIQALHARIAASPVFQAIEEENRRRFLEAAHAIEKANLPPVQARELHLLLEALRKRSQHSEAPTQPPAN